MKSIILDLGCGPNKILEAFGVDVRHIPGVDIVCDIEQALPFKASSVEVIWLRHVIEHVRNLIGLMEEVYRISSAWSGSRGRCPLLYIAWCFPRSDACSLHHGRYLSIF